MEWIAPLIGTGYLLGWAAQANARSDAYKRWPRQRLLCASVAVVLLGFCFSEWVMHQAHGDYRWHMAQHVLIGMVAPLLLVCSAPGTLLLRALPVAIARRLVRCWHSRPLCWAWHPLPASVLHIGGMYLLYLTPLFTWGMAHPAGHVWLHLHFLLAGYLYCQAILGGPDRLPGTASRRTRGMWLWCSAGLHALLGKLMYAGPWPDGAGIASDSLRQGAMLMYYAGDLAELMLMVVFFATRIGLPLAGRYGVGLTAKLRGGDRRRAVSAAVMAGRSLICQHLPLPCLAARPAVIAHFEGPQDEHHFEHAAARYFPER